MIAITSVGQQLEGLKAVAALLEVLWNRRVSHFAVWRYTRRRGDPLPVRAIIGRVWADRAAVVAWAERQQGAQ